VSQCLKILSFQMNENLTNEGEPVDYFGIICHGTASVEFQDQSVKKLSVGDTIGQCFTAEFTTTQNKHLYTIKTMTSGLIAVLPLGEIKSEIRKNPDAVSISDFISDDLSRSAN
jgi:signal-transduction protein with cAMP-binding, CBS, and nucleotidyltransferase domain